MANMPGWHYFGVICSEFLHNQKSRWPFYTTERHHNIVYKSKKLEAAKVNKNTRMIFQNLLHFVWWNIRYSGNQWSWKLTNDIKKNHSRFNEKNQFPSWNEEHGLSTILKVNTDITFCYFPAGTYSIVFPDNTEL